MTRFARAKGSKSSNEKLPEEATSWSDMKKAMLLKSEKIEDSPVKNILSLHKKIQMQEKPSWGSLGDDSCIGSNSLLKQNVNSSQIERISPITSATKNKNKKKKNSIKENFNNKIDLEVKKIKNYKIGKRNNITQSSINEEILESAGKGDRILKNGKKRKLSEPDSAEVFKQKKFKVDSEKKLVKKKKKNQNNKQADKINNEKPKNLIKSKKKNILKNDKSAIQQKPVKDHNNHFNKSYKKNFRDFKKFDREKHKFNSKKQDSAPNELIVNGEKIRLIKFQGFYVTFKDAEKLKKLRADMVKEGIPKAKLEAALKLERRRAEKALARLKKSVCFHCRGSGHLLTNCPLLVQNQNTSTGICYKCGSTEHTSFECKVVKDSNFQFAECFICKEQGHIARQCPDNPKGLYPHGGACKICGDVTHLKKDCPQFIEKKADEAITVNMRNDRDLECLDEEVIYREKKKLENFPKKKSTVKF